MNQDQYNAKRLRRRIWITIIVALLALATVLLSTMSGAFNFRKGVNVLPDLTGMTEEDAVAAIEKLQGKASVSYEPSSRIKGTVIRQGLAAGSTVTPNSTVGIVVSGGKEAEEAPSASEQILPSFIGLSMELAQRSAENLGVTIVENGYVYDDNIPHGSIVEQDPAGGSRAVRGQAVRVRLSAGPETVRYTITVNVSGPGTVSPNTTTVVEGEDVTFTITPNEGYMIESVRVDGEEVRALNRYSFLTVDSNHTLSVTFREQRGALEELIEQFFGRP